MAARRLVAVLIVLLVFSTVAAILVPPPPAREDTSTSSTTTTSRGERPSKGRLVRETLATRAAEPKRIPVRVGDQLLLRVESRRFRQVEVAGFGQIESADRFDPATFDLLPDALGAYPVRVVGSGRVIGRIDVQRRAADR
jgi:hypothetical protein